jgi:hypothetical protein
MQRHRHDAGFIRKQQKRKGGVDQRRDRGAHVTEACARVSRSMSTPYWLA